MHIRQKLRVKALNGLLVEQELRLASPAAKTDRDLKILIQSQEGFRGWALDDEVEVSIENKSRHQETFGTVQTETLNKHMVSAVGSQIAIFRPPTEPMTKQDALLLAAWLVSVAESDSGLAFEDVLKAVQSA